MAHCAGLGYHHTALTYKIVQIFFYMHAGSLLLCIRARRHPDAARSRAPGIELESFSLLHWHPPCQDCAWTNFCEFASLIILSVPSEMSGFTLDSLAENASRLGMRLQETFSEHTRDLAIARGSSSAYLDTADDKLKDVRKQLDSGTDREKLEALKRLVAVRALADSLP